MRRRADPRQIAKLVAVQHAKRAGAMVALSIARDDETLACAQRDAATDEARAAQDDWFGFMAEPGFSPDYARALAGRLIEREAAAGAAEEARQIAADRHVARQQGWRLSEALVRLTESGLARARRDAARNRDEKRLGELSDRTTFNWTRS